MSELTEKKEAKVEIKELLKVIGLLYGILIIVGILTYFIKPGMYDVDETGAIIDGTFHYLETSTNIPWYRWLTVPIENMIWGNNTLMFMIVAVIILLGGCFKVLEECGGMGSLIKVLIKRFHRRRFIAIAVISVMMMLLASFFGLQEELLIIFPICLSFCEAMRWDKKTALSLVLITTAVGFTCALFNPFTIGLCSQIAKVNITDGIWYRLIMLVILGTITCFYLIMMAKNDEKRLMKARLSENDSKTSVSDINLEDMNITVDATDTTKARLVLLLFAFVLVIVIIFGVVPVLRDLGIGLVVMALAFVIGTLVLGLKMIGGFKPWIKAFWHGIINVAPSTLIIIVSFSIGYLAQKANILHTLFHSVYGLFTSVSPYLGVILLLGFILLLEFFIPSSTAKASLIMPLLTLAPIPGISTNVIILAYLLGDGYTNVVYPTCGTLMIGLGLADVTYLEWIKKTGLYQLFLLLTSIGFLMLAIALGL